MTEYYEIELKEALRPAITYSINDLKDPDARTGDFSKTVTLPSSKKLDKLFNHIFEINVETNTFNPNKRLEFDYVADEEIQLKGYLKLNEIVINDYNEVEYRCSLFGKNSDLFSLIADNELTDLTGLDTYNHFWQRGVIENSWDTSIQENGSPVSFSLGKGYVYPLIEYGLDNFSQNPNWEVDHLFPAVYAKEYVDRIFSDAGKSYTSSFFNTTFFKSLIIPFNGTDILKTSTQIDNEVFKADTASQSVTTSWAKIVFPNEVLDAGGVYDNTTGTFTANDGGYYDFSSVIDLQANYTPTGNAVNVYLNAYVRVFMAVYVNGVLKQSSRIFLGDETQAIAPAATYSTGTSVAYPSDAHFTNPNISQNLSTGVWETNKADTKKLNPASNLRVEVKEVLMANGDTASIRVRYDTLTKIDPTKDLFVDGSGNSYSGTITVDIDSGKFLNNITKASVTENGTIDIYSVVPKNIKQKDFLKSIFNMFRLEIQPSKTDPNDYIIEPYSDFYLNTSVDWSTKLDSNRELIFKPMGFLNAQEYLYKYKDDKDYYNELYKTEYGETYGQRSVLIDNDFVKKIQVSELIFSPTPMVQYPSVDLILPTIIKNDTQYKQTDSNIRILFYGGLISTSTVWSITSGGTQTDYTSYPFAGHTDDPYSATVDINFGLPRRLYYDSSFSDIDMTNWNLFNRFHLPYLQQIAQRDSKLVEGWFYLKPSDIAKLTFRKLYFFNNAYHRLVKVENYDPNTPVTKCTFLKVIYQSPFTPVSPWVNGGTFTVGGLIDGIDNGEDLPNVYPPDQTSGNIYSAKSQTINGEDNTVSPLSKNVNVSGDGNIIGGYSKNIELINSNNNTISAGVENVTLINSDNLEVVDSDVVYINNTLISGGDTWIEKSADFNASNSEEKYKIDTSSGSVTATLPSSTNGKVWYFKKMDAANSLIIENKFGTVDEQTSVTITEQYTTIRVEYYNGEYLIT